MGQRPGRLGADSMTAWTARHAASLVALAKVAPALRIPIHLWVAWAIRRAKRIEARLIETEVRA